jgi:NADH:ubiquinone oxidoreductase subunit E
MPKGDGALRATQQPTQPPSGHEDLVQRIRCLPRRRTYLLPALLWVQDDLGWLPGWAIEFVGAHLRVPCSEAFGVASSFPELRLGEPSEHVLLWGGKTSGGRRSAMLMTRSNSTGSG